MDRPSDYPVKLTPQEVDLIDTYFSRNYHPGEPLKVPEGCYQDGLKWKNKTLRELGFQNGIFDGKNARIVQPEKYRPRINLREENRVNNPEVTIEPGHLGFKIWLQDRIEMAAAGKGSPRMLQVDSGSLDEKDAATDKWTELSDNIKKELQKDLLNEEKFEQKDFQSDTKAPILALSIIDKVARYKSEEKLKEIAHLYSKYNEIPEEAETDVFDPIDTLCREIVHALFSNHRHKLPTVERILLGRNLRELKAVAEENKIELQDKSSKEDIVLRLMEATKEREDELQFDQDWGWVKISLTSQSFMLTLADRLSRLMIDEWIPSISALSKEEIKDLRLDEDQSKEFKFLKKKGYFGRRGRPTDPKTAKDREDKTEYNIRRLTRSILFDLVSKEIVTMKKMDFKDWVEHSSEKQKDMKKEGSYSTMIKFSDKLKKWTTNSDYHSFKDRQEHAIYRWLGGEGDRYMYAPPQDHNLTPTGLPKPGGYLTRHHQKLIGGSHYDYERFNTPRCKVSELTIKALNTLQRVQWEINLDLIIKLFELDLADESANLRKYTQINKRITRIECKDWAKDAFYGGDPVKNTERNISLMWARKIINHNANVFWHAWSCDWRGRLYSRGARLSPQGDDLDKALIRFKRWKPLGEKGRKWFFVHVHNMVAGMEWPWKKDPPKKGQSFEDRDAWVDRNKEKLAKLAESPSNYRKELGFDRHSGAKSTTFQRLATLIELNRVVSKCEKNGGDWELIRSGQPVYLDASCNGYQHVSTLLRNRSLAEHVNVTPTIQGAGQVRGDLYKAISDRAFKLAIPGNALYDEIARTTGSKTATKQLIGEICSRNIAKQPTMTRMYGKEQTKDCFSGREGKGKPGWYSSVKLGEDQYKCPKCDYISQKEHWVEKHATAERHWMAKWHEESPLHKALLGRDTNSQYHPCFPDESHKGLTKEVDSLYTKADSEITKGAYKDYRDSVREIAKLGVVRRRIRNISSARKISSGNDEEKFKFEGKIYSGDDMIKLPEHKYVARWQLEDGFQVIQYYIKHVAPSLGHTGNPTHAGSIYRHLLPEWYNPNLDMRKESILKRLEKLGVKGIEPYWSIRLYKDDTKDRKGLLTLLNEILGKKRVSKRSEIEEVRRILDLPSIHLPRYEPDERGRLLKGKQVTSIAPNLIHSLDAYHMRWTINEMSGEEASALSIGDLLFNIETTSPDLDFWAVHDAFGTHARDIPEMRTKIIQGFHRLHEGRNINDWLVDMTRKEMYGTVYNQPSNKKKGYVYKHQLEKLLKDNNIALDTVPSTHKGGGKPTKRDLIDMLVKKKIRPPQNWVAWIDPSAFDANLMEDVRKSEYLVD